MVKKSVPMQIINRVLKYERSTAGTHVYIGQEKTDNPIPTLYIRQSAFPKDDPMPTHVRIQVTL